METLSQAKEYITRKGWNFVQSGLDQCVVEVCPFCGNDNSKFYINVGGTASDGLWDCKVCGAKGSLYQLKTRLGDSMQGVVSMKEAAIGSAPPLPDLTAMQHALHNNPEHGDVLDYLVAERGYSMEVIEKMCLGVEVYDGTKWVVIPYFSKQGNPTYVKYRSVPPAKKSFRSSAGREAPLYNGGIIEDQMEELIFVEGEADALACLSKGIQGVVGVPGAAVKKSTWITRIDQVAPKTMFILYDNDKTGQTSAREMAVKLGIEKVANIVLPEFETIDGKRGKDINEWFRVGHTLEEFEELKSKAKPFDVIGVKNLKDVLEEIKDDIENRGNSERGELFSPWPSLDERLGGANFGEVIGIMAEGKVGKTTMALNWLDYFAEGGYNSLMLCLEMPQKNLVRKWVGYKTLTDDKDITKETVDESLVKAQALDGDLLFGFTRSSKPEDVFDTIRQAIRRYGVKIVCFDNLQFLCRSVQNQAQETSKYSKMFKELAMEMNVLVLLIIQPNRVREGDIVAARNAAGSSAIEKDVDAMIALHRNRVGTVRASEFGNFLESNETFAPQMLVKVDLTRYAPGGNTTLYMEGAKSYIRSFTEEDIAAMQVPKTELNIPVETKKQMDQVPT